MINAKAESPLVAIDKQNLMNLINIILDQKPAMRTDYEKRKISILVMAEDIAHYAKYGIHSEPKQLNYYGCATWKRLIEELINDMDNFKPTLPAHNKRPLRRRVPNTSQVPSRT
jgi:hypothetical protein